MLIFSFNREANIDLWKVVDDVVMGGVSKSEMKLDDHGFGVFQGQVSLKNNGGFASVHFQTGQLDVSKFTGIKLRLRGDGKRYQFRLKSDVNHDYAFVHFFNTSGEWQVLEMPLSEFVPRYRGKPMDLPKFNRPKLEQIAFLIANRSEERFRLTIDRIELVE